MEENKKAVLYLMVLMLLASFVLSLFTLPLPSQNQEPSLQPGKDQVATLSRKLMMVEKHSRRVIVAVNDYPGPGSNNRHDPKSPGTP